MLAVMTGENDTDVDDADMMSLKDNEDDFLRSVLSLVVQFQVHAIMNFIWKLLRFQTGLKANVNKAVKVSNRPLTQCE